MNGSMAGKLQGVSDGACTPSSGAPQHRLLAYEEEGTKIGC